MNYIDKILFLLNRELNITNTDYEELLKVYAVLVVTVGENCTNENIHDAWSVWQNDIDSYHKSLKPFNELTKKVQDLDEPYKHAVIKVARLIK